MNREKVIVFGLGQDYDNYFSALKEIYDIVGVSDHYSAPQKNLFISPRDIIKNQFDHIVICSRAHADEIIHYLKLYLDISDSRLIRLENIVDKLDKVKLDQFKSGLKQKRDDRIFVIGDSHAGFFGDISKTNELRWNKFIDFEYGLSSQCPESSEHNLYGRMLNYFEPDIYPFIPFHIGPALAFHINSYGTRTGGREKTEYLLKEWIPINSSLMFVLGEIDLRVHAIKQHEIQNRPVEKIVEEIADRYLNFLKIINDRYKVYVWGAIASQGDSGYDHPRFPKYGSMKERNYATECFNHYMEKQCEEIGIQFISVFDYLVDKNYNTRLSFYMPDLCHLNRDSWGFAKCEFAKAGIDVDV